jgi:CHAT domain-containing protein
LRSAAAAGDALPDYAALPGTRSEADAIAALFRRAGLGRADLLAGAEATEGRLRAALPGHRYLHLGTHGYFAPPQLKAAGSFDLAALNPETAGQLGREEVQGLYPGLLSALVWAGAHARRRTPPPARSRSARGC